jgi:hypothetical protein
MSLRYKRPESGPVRSNGGARDHENCSGCGTPLISFSCRDCRGTGCWLAFVKCRTCDGTGQKVLCPNFLSHRQIRSAPAASPATTTVTA